MTDKSQFVVSVVIPTRNRKRLLTETLQALAQQSLKFDQFEVIVVDNCSNDGTEQMVAEFQVGAPYALRYYRNDKNRGPVYSRNRGVNQAIADIIAFTDDDCAPAPQWLERGIEPFRDEKIGLVCGPTCNKPGQPVRFFSLGAVSSPAENPIYPTCNVIYRRRAIDDVGGFDQSIFLFDMGGVPCEAGDADLAWRVKESGWVAYYAPGAVVYHEVRQVSPYNWLAAHVRMTLIPLLIQRHPGLREKIIWWGPFCRPEHPLFYLGLLGIGLAPFLNLWLLLLCVPFLMRMGSFFGRNWAFLALPRFMAQIAFASARQAVICGSLVYGSIRTRTLVL